MEKERYVEGVWDCSYCQKKDIKASEKVCPTCGHPQDEQTKFRLPTTISYVSDNEQVSEKSDWVCSYCSSLNKDSDMTCKNCGAKKEDSEKNYLDLQRKKTVVEENKKSFEQKKEDANSLFYKIMISVFALAMCLVFVFFVHDISSFFAPQEVVLQNFKWERSVEIEEYKTYNESDWKLPSNAELYDTKKELHHYEQKLSHYKTVNETKTKQVLDHYETVVTGYKDLGNGYFKEQTKQKPIYKTETYTEQVKKPVYHSVPIYKTKYYYKIKRWKTIRTDTTTGNDQSPYDTTSKLSKNQRLGKKTEIYTIIVLTKDNEQKEYTVDFNDWKTLKKGQKIKITSNLFNQATIEK